MSNVLQKLEQLYPVPRELSNSLLGLYHECWVCQQRLSNFGGRSDLEQHVHHIIPRAFGGSAGPTVSLCSGHHSLVHKIALKLSANRSYFELTPKDPEIANRVMFLSSRIAIAAAQFSDDPNKRFPVVVSLHRADHSKLKALTEKLSCSRENLVLSLIRKEFNAQFPMKK